MIADLGNDADETSSTVLERRKESRAPKKKDDGDDRDQHDAPCCHQSAPHRAVRAAGVERRQRADPICRRGRDAIGNGRGLASLRRELRWDCSLDTVMGVEHRMQGEQADQYADKGQ